MKICIYLSSLFFFILSNTKASAQDTIYWKSNYNLKWDDFKGRPDSLSEFDAVGSPGLRYNSSYNEKSFNTNVACYFVRSKAWSKYKTSDTLLKHEQVHFDIAELFARKLRKSFSEYKFNPQTINSDFKRIFTAIKQQKDSLNAVYDKETDFSRNRKQQILWNKRIAEELNKLNCFSSN